MLERVEFFGGGPNKTLTREVIEFAMRSHLNHLADAGISLGDGKTAEVFEYGFGNETLCVKMVDESRLEQMYGTVAEAPKCNTPELEAHYMRKARAVVGELAVIPTPVATATMKREDGTLVRALIMQRLDAVSLRDLHYRTEPVPDALDVGKFCEDLRSALGLIHDSAGVFHRDINEPNIMVERATGRPCIIDFGDSTALMGEDLETPKAKAMARGDIAEVSGIKNRLDALVFDSRNKIV